MRSFNLFEFRSEATAAAPYAVFFGKEFNVAVYVCHQIAPIAGHNAMLRTALAGEFCQTMRGALDDHASQWCTPAFHLHRGMGMEDIIARTQSQHAGLIMLNVRLESHPGRHLHTSFASRLLARANCPVLSVPPPAARRPGPAV